MIDTTNINMSNTNETAAAVEETAPAETTPATAASGNIPAADKALAGMVSARNPVPATLPSGYLANGSMIDADGVMLPEYLGEYAEKIAQSLEPLKASTFQRAFLTKARDANKKKVPYSVKKNCTQGMTIAALKLVSRKKDPAPRVLLDMIRAATATVVDDATFDVLYMHLDAIYTNLLVG